MVIPAESCQTWYVLECHGDLYCIDADKDGTFPIFKWLFVWPKLITSLAIPALLKDRFQELLLPLVCLIKKR